VILLLLSAGYPDKLLLMTAISLIFPSDIMEPRKPDEHFAPEFEAARHLGLDAYIIDDQKLREGEVRQAVAKIPAGRRLLYRGWMLTAAEYAELDKALTEKDSFLSTSAAQYQLAHELVGWYETFSPYTPRSVWATDGEDDQQLLELLNAESAIVKDYVKSAKHLWDEACYIPDAQDTRKALEVINRFREVQEDRLIGGIVLREFESLKALELRSWWMNGECKLLTPHPDEKELLSDDSLLEFIAELKPLVNSLGVHFISIDLALTTDNKWRVIEIGDGQVSDRHKDTDPVEFFEKLLLN
jgi:hypothetical protein